MVQITENVELEKLVIDKLRKKVGPRSVAKSVTKYTCCPRKTFFRMVGMPGLISNGTTLTFSRGRAHHDLLEVFSPTEVNVEKDGIPGHIDMVYDHPVEVYTTVVSANAVEKAGDVPRIFPLKYKQLCAYVYMRLTGEWCSDVSVKIPGVEYTDFLSEPGIGYLMPFHLMGDYSRPIRPQLKVWTLEYTIPEMERNWNEILEKKDYIEDCIASGRIPEWTGYDFECLNCEFNPVCHGLMIKEEKKEDMLL